ncbi:hypothetical protein [Ruminiclostridium papyrosolvens]|uniref:Butirosin biosynthesis protein H N-terminal domain-containing protein n=1 Tax=Ruminiclostridium papyrosolvens C7 TaxID=1330534 RepID=U4R285_9FIRM|nr:hypothetical protein [Ruminiclostridium papyrosolvens]EPR12197.1 hypothetical protein L323_08820 [Ruminiclostridium papyrosolvens C7]
MKHYEIKNVSPFNTVYYVDCFFLALFTAIKAFNGSIFSYISNDYFAYNLEETHDGLSLIIQNNHVRPFSELEQYNGILTESKFEYYDNIVDILKEALLNQKLIIIPVDGFYYKHPYHDLFYLKHHHYQSMLIYGFDSERNVFLTVEANGLESDSERCFYKHEISFQDIKKCHEGVVNYVQGGLPTIRLISKVKPEIKINDDPHLYKNTMINNLLANREMIFNGLKSIHTLADNIEQFDMSETACFTNKVASASNLFKFKNILGEKSRYIPEMVEIYKAWAVMRDLTYRDQLRGGVRDKKKYYSKLCRIYEMENKLYKSLFDSLDSISANNKEGNDVQRIWGKFM